MFYQEALSELNRRRVKYLVVGGVAVNLWGAQRLTHDLDLLVDLTPTNLRRLVAALGGLGYIPRVPVNPKQLAERRVRLQWIREKNMKVFSFCHPSNPLQVVDILIADGRYGRFAKRQGSAQVGSLRVPLVSIEDLITMKSDAGRKQDRADAALLRKVRRILREREKED